MSHFVEAFKQKFGRGELWALSAAVAYSLSAVFTSLAIRGQEINYQLASSLRSLPVLLFSIFMVTIFNKKNKPSTPPFKDFKLILALIAYGILTFFLGNSMFFGALQKGGVLITSPLVGTQILWAAIFAAVLLRERLNWKMIAGMILSINRCFHSCLW